MELPFTVGEERWLPGSCPEKVTVPCPVCSGNMTILVTLGSGERLVLPCEGCSLGYDGSRGYTTEWSYEPRVESFVIQEPCGLYNEEWTVRSTTGAEAKLKDLYLTETAALVAATEHCRLQLERNMETRQRKRKGSKSAGWTIRYHREMIADLERQISWHKGKLGL